MKVTRGRGSWTGVSKTRGGVASFDSGQSKVRRDLARKWERRQGGGAWRKWAGLERDSVSGRGYAEPGLTWAAEWAEPGRAGPSGNPGQVWRRGGRSLRGGRIISGRG